MLKKKAIIVLSQCNFLLENLGRDIHHLNVIVGQNQFTVMVSTF